MVCVAGEGQGVLEILDLVGGGDEQEKKTLKIPQSVRVAELVSRVSNLYKYKIGSVGLVLLWNRNKVDLMNVRRDHTIAEIGVDFTSGTAYRLLITEWQPSLGDEQKMPCADGGGPSVILEVLDLTTGDFAHTNLEIGPATRVNGLFRLIERNHKPGTFGLFLRCRRNKVKLNDKDTRKLTEVGVDLSSPGTVMLLVTEPADSPAESRRTTPTTTHAELRPDRNTEKIRTNDMEFDALAMKPRGKRWMIGFDDEVPAKAESERIEEQGHEDIEPNRRSENAYVGLVNQAMTCYLNSLIQALYMTPEFRNALYNWEYVNDPEKDEANSIPYQLQKLFLNLQTSSKNAIETTSLTKSFGWDSTEAWQQHDIQELCRVMFDALEQKFKNTEQADLINRLYEGKMIDYVKCLECGTEKSREDTFLDIPLPVKPFGSNVAYNSVEEALNAFVQPETLDDTNQYHCEKCNKKCDAHKGLKFTKFPYLLTLHLKRFDFDYNTFHRIKLNDEVTFPDVLNLNSFIPSESPDAPCNEEDAGVGVKCEEGSTTDSVALDEKCPSSEMPENGMSVSDHSANHDHDDDSGIDLSNGPSTSSCSANNHDNEKNRDNRAAPKGPYEYELFSIMIHSGSASGGHYYAYIKDFRTGQWLCFNDQNVSPITYDDIQKTYGGGPIRAYYSGVYSSSTNAYMLMYRQIDPVRNALPMQVKDFPKHLQDLLLKMQDNQDMSCRDNSNSIYRLKVYCQQRGQKTMTGVKLRCRRIDTWGDLTRRAYLHFCHEGLIPRDRVRLVTYQEHTETIECSYDDREGDTLCSILDDRRTLLMEIREPDETFKPYLPGGVVTKVMVVDPANKEVVKGPIKVRGHATQTIADYKIQLSEIVGLEPKDINLIVQYPNNPEARLITKDDSTLQIEDLASSEKIFVPTCFDHENPKDVELALDEIMELYGDLITLNIYLPDTSEEALREMNIPSLEDKTKEKAVAEISLTNGPSKPSQPSPTATEVASQSEKPEVTGSAAAVAAASTPSDAAAASKATAAAAPGANAEEFSTHWVEMTSPPGVVETQSEDWCTPEQSNSEDSSLSYSDRTLVGEDEASEDDDYPVANVEHLLFHPTENENWDVDPVEYYFRATPHPDKLLRILADKRMSLGTLKKLLEPFVGVPMEYFKICRQWDGDSECNRLTVSLNRYKDGETLHLKLGRALRTNEIKVKLYQLLLQLEEPYRYLCEWIVSKDATVGQTKKEILAELRKKFDIHIPFDRCRLRRKSYKTAAKVFLDDQRIKDLNLYYPYEIIVQELQEKEQVTDQNDIVVFARLMSMQPILLGPYIELVVRGKSIAEVRQQLSEISLIPEEYLEMAKGKCSLPSDLMLLAQHNTLDWNRQSTTPDNSSEITLEDGIVIYYRDYREKVQEPSAEEVQDMKSKTKSRMLGISSSSRYSPRRERALKIYIDDK